MQIIQKQFKTFCLKEGHLKLLQRAYISWNDAEFGAPTINPKKPFGNSDVIEDVFDILGWNEDTLNPDVTELIQGEIEQNARDLYDELEVALQICLSTQSFKPGYYVSPLYPEKWTKITYKNYQKLNPLN